DKGNIDLELTELGSQIDKIMTDTKFNGIGLTAGSVTIQSDDSAQKITIKAVSTAGFSGLTSSSSLGAIETAIQNVATQRATLGATQNRLEYTSNNLGTVVENLTAAESRIRDTDMAKEMVDLTRNNILLQASQAMLAQANMQPQGVLTLLR